MDGFKFTLRVIGVLLGIIGAIAAIYYAATKILNSTRYFCDDDADIVECECCADTEEDEEAETETEE